MSAPETAALAPPFRFDVLTLFPGVFDGFVRESLIGKAIAAGLIAVALHDWRPFAENKHGRVDDAPFGGGAGMVLAPGPVLQMLDAVDPRPSAPLDAASGDGGDDGELPRRPRLLLSPAGRPLDQALAQRLAAGDGVVLLCGRYEGFDARVEGAVDALVSVGDVVLNGGEVPAMAVIEAVARLRPGVLGNSESVVDESHQLGLVEAPQYTRPRVFRGQAVPEALLSGDHGKIAAFRNAEAVARTRRLRPDLYAIWLAQQPPAPTPRRKRPPRPEPDDDA